MEDLSLCLISVMEEGQGATSPHLKSAGATQSANWPHPGKAVSAAGVTGQA